MKAVATFILHSETKGAVRYQEVDSSGSAMEMADASVHTLYLRKTFLKAQGAKVPQALKITIESK
jgi:hypothetical protein